MKTSFSVLLALLTLSGTGHADSTKMCKEGFMQYCCSAASQGRPEQWLNRSCSLNGIGWRPSNACQQGTLSETQCTTIKQMIKQKESDLKLNASQSKSEEISASYMKCAGTDTVDNSIYLMTYPNSPVVNINGDMLNIVGKTRNGQGVVTQNFLSVYGVVVYDSLVPVNNNSITIYQFNAVTEALLAQAWLTCNFYGNAAATKASVSDYPMLNAIKPNVLKMADGMPYNKAKESVDHDPILSSASGNA